MRHTLFLATRAMWWYRGRTITMIACLALTMWLPITVRIILNHFCSEITARADSTPLLIGAVGSRIDLALHALYFDGVAPGQTTMAEVSRVQATSPADAIPVYIKYQTQSRNHQPGVAIVGTSTEYFDFRNLRLQCGYSLALLGDCVAGSAAAAQLGLSPGDSILSAPRNAFDLAGDYPLKLNVVGVLAPSYSPDDHVVFVDVRTAWIIDGIGHGHQSLSKSTDASLLLEASDEEITASAAVLPYTEITQDNIDSFHFHGDPDTYPVSAVIAAPPSERERILLLGRYQSKPSQSQCIQPPEVVGELLSIVFRVQQLVRISSGVAVVVTLALLGLVLSLSLRLREPEVKTMYRIGCSRGTIGRVLSAEILIMLMVAAALATLAAWSTQSLFGDLLRQMLF